MLLLLLSLLLLEPYCLFFFQAVFLPQSGYDKDTILEKGIEKDIEDIEFVNHINGFVKEDEALGNLSTLCYHLLRLTNDIMYSYCGLYRNKCRATKHPS